MPQKVILEISFCAVFIPDDSDRLCRNKTQGHIPPVILTVIPNPQDAL